VWADADASLDDDADLSFTVPKDISRLGGSCPLVVSDAYKLCDSFVALPDSVAVGVSEPTKFVESDVGKVPKIVECDVAKAPEASAAFTSDLNPNASSFVSPVADSMSIPMLYEIIEY